MKKKMIWASSILLASTLALTTGAMADSDIKLFVNGKQSTADIQIIDGSSYVPLRAVAEMLGADVKWDGDSRTITITGKDYKPDDMTSAAKSYNVNVDIKSGPMQMHISKVTLDPAFQKDQYSDKINAIVFDVSVENTSDNTIDWYPVQGTFVLNTKEQAEGGSSMYYSDQVDGEFVGKVVKTGKIVVKVNSMLDQVTSINYKISGASDSKLNRVGDDTTTPIILQ